MNRLIGPSSAFGLAVAAIVSLQGRPQTTPDLERTVYLTAIDQRGAYVDLAPADLVVKEGGREREIRGLEPSSVRLRVALAIEDGLSPDATVRRAAARFVEQLHSDADIAVVTLGRGPTRLVDYTSDLRLLQNGIAALPQRPQGDGNLVESLYELARAQRSLEGRRSIVVLATEVPQRSSVTANGVLDQLRDTGAVLHAVTLVSTTEPAPPTPDMQHMEATDEVERDKVMGDGTRQSGGLRIAALRVENFTAALDRIRGELIHQQRLTYLMPAGSKSDGRLTITTRRRGVTVRAPTLLPRL